MQSKKRIKQIGPFSFLFCNLPDTIYNIKTEKAQNNKSFDVVIIKLKQTSTTLFKKTIDMENFWMFSNPTKKLTTAFDIIVDLNYFIYNHFFCIKETVDDLTLTIFFDENPKNNRTISLNRVEDNDDLLKKSKKDYVTEIKNLIDTLQYQKEKIAKEFGAIACEMEGGAIGHTCMANKVPFAVLRSISDGGDSSAQIDYPTFKMVAAKISTSIILEFIKTLKTQLEL